LAKAVQDGDKGKIDQLVAKEPALINYQDPKYGSTLLMLTIMSQQMKSFGILLDNKADVNIHDTFSGTSALIEACSDEEYDTKYAEILLERGANVNDVETGPRKEGNSTRFTPLMAACRDGRRDLADLLIKKGANVNYQNEYKQTALSEAVMVYKYNTALYLLEHGADYKQPIFYRPEENRQMYLVDMLREYFVDLDTGDHKYKMKAVEFLKGKGIDYKSTPIPEFIKKKAQEEYPKSWQEYLEKY
jgi:ankyrin repeat protein